MDDWDAGLRKAVNAMIPEVEGKPVVNTGFYDGGVYICRRISGLHTCEDSYIEECEWIDPEEARPGELTDEMSISCDCVRLGPGWWSPISAGTSSTIRNWLPKASPGITLGWNGFSSSNRGSNKRPN